MAEIAHANMLHDLIVLISVVLLDCSVIENADVLFCLLPEE